MDKIFARRISYLILVVLFFVLIFTSYSFITYADSSSTSGSDVLDDLARASNFNVENYPEDNTNNSLTLFQIAESLEKELLLYVYQPNVEKDFRCSSVNISRGINDSISYQNYSLTYCNHSGTLYKYKVNDFEVSTDSVRYYSISQIMRPFDASIDADPGAGNSISEVPCPVGKEWAFYVLNGNPVIDCVDIETIRIETKYCGYIRYRNGFFFPGFYCDNFVDSHFVAFSTDRDIEELYEADLQYYYQSYSYNAGDEHSSTQLEPVFGDVETSEVVTLHNDQLVENDSNRFLSHKYKFYRIQSVDDLLEEENLKLSYEGVFVNVKEGVNFSQEAHDALNDCQWVLRFLETSVNETAYTHFNRYSTTRVSDVILLRLRFKTDGVIYNLGVIDNKQTGALEPAGWSQFRVEASDFLKTLLWLLLVVLLAIVLPYVLRLIKLIFKIITFPFRLLFGARKLRKERQREEKIDNLVEEAARRSPMRGRYRR